MSRPSYTIVVNGRGGFTDWSVEQVIQFTGIGRYDATNLESIAVTFSGGGGYVITRNPDEEGQ